MTFGEVTGVLNARCEFPMCELVLQHCYMNALRLDAAHKRVVELVCRICVMT